jgi:hypothetical protein
MINPTHQPLGPPSPPELWLGEQAHPPTAWPPLAPRALAGGAGGGGGEGRPRVRLFGFSPEGGTSLPLVRKPPDLGSPPLKPKRSILAGLVKFLAVGCGLNENYFLANFSAQ